MDISVIVPTYKPGEYIWECLDSLCSQTLAHDRFEVIVVLNGCDKPFSTRITDYIKSKGGDTDFIYLQTDDAGVSNARNLALDIARGEYITFVDDDDYVSPTYLEELFAHAAPDIVSLSYELAFNDLDRTLYPYYITDEYEKCASYQEVFDYRKARRFFNGPVYKLIHRDMIGERRYDKDMINGEDSVFMFLISDKFSKVSLTTRQAVYFRRFRAGQATDRMNNKKIRFKNGFRIVSSYCKIFFHSPFKYDILFFMNCVMAATKSMFFK